MSPLKRFFLIHILLFSSTLFAQEWMVLQQGMNNYDGCEDVTLLTNTNGNNTHMAGWNSTTKDRILLCQYKKDDGNELNQARTVIRFDLSPLPASIKVTEAALDIYREGSFWDKDTFPNLDKDAIFEVRKVSKMWDSSNATWDSLATSFEQELLDSFNYTSGSSRWYKFDVKTAIDSFLADSSKNYGFMLFSNNEALDTNTGSVSKFYSAEYSTPSMRPMLTVHFEYVDTVPPTAEVISPNGGEEFDEGDVTHMIFDADDDIKLVSRTVEFSSDSGATWETIDNSSYSSSFTWTLPAVTSNNCKIKLTVYDVGGNAGIDESDTTFKVTANISITTPQVYSSPITIKSLNKNGMHLSTPRNMSTDIVVYSLNGLVLEKITGRRFKTGNNRVAFGRQLPSGIYIVEINGKEFTTSRKFVVKE